ncbi:hypothetical protein [Mycobacterium hackensackense]|uniref:hypothetical protein n=1 Tax=Mycobacterium hackensackense TaxID=228909 RepID=UPI0022658C7A|nr:hypothetical protein [Mycobacterium hackensackense]
MAAHCALTVGRDGEPTAHRCAPREIGDFGQSPGSLSAARLDQACPPARHAA